MTRFQVRAVAVPPGSTLPYVEGDWRDALVVVHYGEIELECVNGTRRRFADGDVLWLAGLPLRAVHNSGAEPALLAAVSRAIASR
jgi:hypothetical protein